MLNLWSLFTKIMMFSSAIDNIYVSDFGNSENFTELPLRSCFDCIGRPKPSGAWQTIPMQPWSLSSKYKYDWYCRYWIRIILLFTTVKCKRNGNKETFHGEKLLSGLITTHARKGYEREYSAAVTTHRDVLKHWDLNRMYTQYNQTHSV